MDKLDKDKRLGNKLSEEQTQELIKDNYGIDNEIHQCKVHANPDKKLFKSDMLKGIEIGLQNRFITELQNIEDNDSARSTFLTIKKSNKKS